MFDLDGNFIETFSSIAKAAKSTGHCNYTICKICQSKQQKVCNHIFKYKL
jgi:hypothetical protein